MQLRSEIEPGIWCSRCHRITADQQTAPKLYCYGSMHCIIVQKRHTVKDNGACSEKVTDIGV